MTQTQKIIKYLAIAFGIFLVVTIISAILAGIYSFRYIFGFKSSNEFKDLKVISSEMDEVTNLNIRLGFTNLEIKESDSFKIETNNSKIDYSEDSGNIIIEEREDNIFKHKNSDKGLIIYLPKNMQIMNEVEITMGAGKLEIDSLKAEELYLKLGAGEVNIKNLIVTDEIKLEGGAGKTQINSSELKNLRAQLGVGEFILNGKLIGENKVKAGIGSVVMNLTDNIENYCIKAQKGIGSIVIDGKQISNNVEYGSGDSYLSIEGGIGSINIK